MAATSRLDRVVPIVAGVAVLGLCTTFLRAAACGERREIEPAASTPAAAGPARTPNGSPRSARLPITTAASAPDAAVPSAFRELLGSPQIDPREPDYDPVAAYELGGGGNIRDRTVAR